MTNPVAWVTIVSILAITVLEAIALARGIDGTAFGIVITALAGLGGYSLKEQLSKRE